MHNGTGCSHLVPQAPDNEEGDAADDLTEDQTDDAYEQGGGDDREDCGALCR
jgi:hypothetical protein